MKKAKLLDVGCGEGFYPRGFAKEIENVEVYAFDNAKDGIVLSSKKEEKVNWFVDDLANIPLKDKSMDLLINMFTPSNYNEFIRILKDDGYLIKVFQEKII